MKGKFLNLLFIIVMGSFLLNLSMFVVARVLYNIENNNDMDELQVEVQTQRKVEIDDNVKKILQYLFEDNLKEVINDEKYKVDYIKKAILVLENYINFNLDTNINAKKILWGALLW